MHLLSKNSSLEESIAKMQKALDEVQSVTTLSSFKHPLENCFSINLSSNDAPKNIYSNGKGINEQACLASAYGEYIERLQTNNFFNEFYLPNRKHYPDEVAFDFDDKYLDEDLIDLYNPDGELFPEDYVDFNSNHNDKIVSLPFINLTSSKTAYIPTNILHNLYVSNGLATGNTPKEAQVQAISEIYERYAKIQIIKNGYSLPKYPKDVVNKYTKLTHDLDSLKELGYIVEVLDASLGGKFPVVAISLINPKTSTLFVSFGAHPIQEVAFERTMTELMQGRNLDDMDSFEVPTFDMSLVQDNFNIESHFIDSNGKLGFNFLNSTKSFKYSLWKYDGKNTDDEYEFLVNISQKMKKDVYLREYNYLGFYSCQVVIPTISEIYPFDDLIYNNANVGKKIREMVLHFKDYDVEEILELTDDLQNDLDIEKYIGVIFENNFFLSDFKAQLYLMLGDFSQAIQMFELSKNPLGFIIAQIIRIYEDELIWDDYEEALYNIFTKEKVEHALNIFNGDDYFIDTTYHQDYLNMLNLYDRLAIKKLS